MTRERKVWPRDQVAHLWANRSCDEARDPSGNFYFHGSKLNSYGSHFVIGYWLDVGADSPRLVWNPDRYSKTTGKHKDVAWHALAGWQRRDQIEIDGLRDDDFSGRARIIRLAQKALTQAGDAFDSATRMQRLSQKRTGALDVAHDRMKAARVVAELALSGKGDAASQDHASAKREARAMLATIAKVEAAHETWTRTPASDRKAENAQELAYAAACARLLRLDEAKRELADYAERAWRSFNDANAADVGLGMRFNYAKQAVDVMQRAKDCAKLYKLRPLKLPEDALALVAELRPAVEAAQRERDVRRAKRDLACLESAYRARNYWALRHKTFMSFDDPALPEWMKARAAQLWRKAERAMDILSAKEKMARTPSAMEHAREREQAGMYRDAAAAYRRIQSEITDAARIIPSTHPGFPHVSFGHLSFIALQIQTLSARFAAEDAALIAAWRAGNGGQSSIGRLTTLPLLRVRGESIETSHGAIVPLSVAPALWRIVSGARAQGSAHSWPDHSGPRIGSFHLNEVRANGSIVVGCHTIEWTELEAVARQLGYLTTAAA